MRTAAPIAAARALAALALGTYLLAGAVWFLRHLGEVPHYGDTLTYLEFARRMEVNAHRGILYPMLLSRASRCITAGGSPFICSCLGVSS